MLDAKSALCAKLSPIAAPVFPLLKFVPVTETLSNFTFSPIHSSPRQHRLDTTASRPTGFGGRSRGALGAISDGRKEIPFRLQFGNRQAAGSIKEPVA